MNIYYNTSFEGKWPVGTAALVRSVDEIEAAGILKMALKAAGLRCEIDPADMIEFHPNEQCVILNDGDY